MSTNGVTDLFNQIFGDPGSNVAILIGFFLDFFRQILAAFLF
jgi:uncharacterized PurR-regulated membrane protein YhhQ (DUF165 family)